MLDISSKRSAPTWHLPRLVSAFRSFLMQLQASPPYYVQHFTCMCPNVPRSSTREFGQHSGNSGGPEISRYVNSWQIPKLLMPTPEPTRPSQYYTKWCVYTTVAIGALYGLTDSARTCRQYIGHGLPSKQSHADVFRGRTCTRGAPLLR